MLARVYGTRHILKFCREAVAVLRYTGAPPSRKAGHSHWQNIRHIKDEKDTLKQKVANDIVRKIKVAVQEAGGITNPKLNSTLAKVLEEGKSKAVASDTMVKALQRLEKARNVKGAQTFVEARAMGNFSFIVEVYTDRSKFIRQQLQHIFKKYGGRIGEAGTAAPSFHFKGVVYTAVPEGFTMDQALEAAIEAGAEDVRHDVEEQMFEFICEARELHAVKGNLANLGFTIRDARQEFIPHSFVPMDRDSIEVVRNMVDELESLEEVTRVFDNVQVADS